MSIFSDFIDLFFPVVCLGCEKALVTGETVLCVSCTTSLPLAVETIKSDDKVRDLFYGRVDVEAATSLFYYEKIGVVQRMIHQLKYANREEVSSFLGEWLGAYLSKDDRFKDVEFVVPVPVHPRRLRKRGYNQVTGFGKAISDALGVRFRESVLIKTHNTVKQAQLNQKSRSDERTSPYLLQQNLPADSHILLVDDVITTGTTLSLCAKELTKIEGVKIYIATMAVAV